MVKAASHHGLDRKYKPWRRGKSQNAKGKKGSLKQQLRGLRRLLPKATDDDHRAKIEDQIRELETQIDGKQKVEQQKANARKSHGVRFLERQRLTRLWQNAAKNSDAKERELEQYRVGLDMLYVAHYPLETRYQPLFRKKERIILDGRNLARRAAARGKILRQVESLPRANWIPSEVYDNCPKEWSNQKEREIFGVVAPSSETNPVLNDDRFASAPNSHATLLQAAEELDAQLDAEQSADSESNGSDKEEKAFKASNDDNSSSSEGIVSDSDDSDDADPLQKSTSAGEKRKRPIGEAEEESQKTEDVLSETHSSSESESSDDSSSSDSSSSDESEDGEDDEVKQTIPNAEEEADEVNIKDDEDDFLMAPDAAEYTRDIFAEAKEHIPSIDEARGDKSKGWATQRQRPGQFKKRRIRK